ncbi:MAG: SDR family oxidoreductase, partial [Gemmatimonadetes bacterium]|nr:SDR family oxidoreductase [Gemmatimonadota bacterium]
AAFAASTAIGRLIEPAEIAEAIAFLASERAGGTVGAALVVDAGYTTR